MLRNRFRSGRTYFEKRQFRRGRTMPGVTSQQRSVPRSYPTWAGKHFRTHLGHHGPSIERWWTYVWTL